MLVSRCFARTEDETDSKREAEDVSLYNVVFRRSAKNPEVKKRTSALPPYMHIYYFLR